MTLYRKAFIRSLQAKLPILLFAGTLLTAMSHSVLADSYLDALANEADATAKVTTNNRRDPAEQKKFQKMEALIENERPSTYKFYTKLYPKNKERVFEIYMNDTSSESNKLSHLQEKIMDLYFAQK